MSEIIGVDEIAYKGSVEWVLKMNLVNEWMNTLNRTARNPAALIDLWSLPLEKHFLYAQVIFFFYILSLSPIFFLPLSPFSFFLSPHSPSYISQSFSLVLFVFSIISFMMSSFRGLNSSALVQTLIFWLRCRSLLAAPAPGTAGFAGSERRSPAGPH